jgi:plastocyanin
MNDHTVLGGRNAMRLRPRRLLVTGSLIVVLVSVAAAEKISILDNCDPTDPGWAPTGGCLLEEGDVRVAEFNALLSSPLSESVVGHPSWRNHPSYITVEAGETVRVKNRGGRTHTFTEVAQFGGGKIPALNQGLSVAPECPDSTNLPSGATSKVTDLGVGIHRFQCCIHPWMRAVIRVTPE